MLTILYTVYILFKFSHKKTSPSLLMFTLEKFILADILNL